MRILLVVLTLIVPFFTLAACQPATPAWQPGDPVSAPSPPPLPTQFWDRPDGSMSPATQTEIAQSSRTIFSGTVISLSEIEKSTCGISPAYGMTSEDDVTKVLLDPDELIGQVQQDVLAAAGSVEVLNLTVVGNKVSCGHITNEIICVCSARASGFPDKAGYLKIGSCNCGRGGG